MAARVPCHLLNSFGICFSLPASQSNRRDLILHGMKQSPVILFFKSHIDGYMKRDGSFVAPHNDKRTKAKTYASKPVTSTPNFAAWFGDSKVVDKKGQPLVVYHGTSNDVSEFQEQNIKRPYNGHGHHFATKPSVANHYSEHAYLSSGNVMPVYLSIRNPFTGDFFDFKKENGFGPFDDYEATEALKKLGYDGIRYDDTKGMPRGKGGVNYVAFDPHQIKSAMGNNGEFDRSSPDITKSLPVIFIASRYGPDTRPRKPPRSII